MFLSLLWRVHDQFEQLLAGAQLEPVTGGGAVIMDYGEGSKYYDEAMQDILMDSSEREMREIAEYEQAEADAERDFNEEQAALRAGQEA